MNSFISILDMQETKISARREIVEYLLYSALAFTVPFILGHPQLLVGTIVNATLILAALNLTKSKILPIIILPSFAVLSRGLIFGSFTMFLVYTIPFIWIGNSVLVYMLKHLYLGRKWNRNLSLAFGIIAKVAILYLSTLIMIRLGILPRIFATAMGSFQLYTALGGAVLALTTQKILRLK